MDKQERKDALKKFKEQENETKISNLPMSVQLLKKFFDFLDERLKNEEEGNSLKLTEEFCKKENLNFDNVKTWAEDFGGYNDEEILLNVEQEYEFLIGE